ncbi:MAG TPA: asparagine synthase (glutamine-hydrolyzing) [Candidatus Paceibacterota bacterium]
MCGIIAITGKNAVKMTNIIVSNMLSRLSKRGPDDRGYVNLRETILGQTRLSIIDIEEGHQPMKDIKYPHTIVFNGEIYGYKKLRENLEKKGHIFNTRSDTEVILKSYAEYGEKCVDHLDGMFAFAIWDETKDELFIARDRFGKKPFYYTFVDTTFIGASEIKALFATNMIKGQIDPLAIDDYLLHTYIPPHKTIYSNIQTLPPAYACIVKNGKIEKTWKYWKLEKKEISISYEEAKQQIKKLFDNAVKKRMVADVEIGSLLSGGVDSTLVTYYAQKYSSRPIKTFVVGYADGVSELPYAKEASLKIGTDHQELIVRGNNLAELKKVIAYFDEPHADSSDFPQHLISKLASSKVKVALSGDGADELFMGYGWYQRRWHAPFFKRIFFHFIDKMNATDLSVYLPGQLLTKIDRTSMMNSLEIRSPFLDTELAEFVYNLPWKFKVNKTENKIILKDILSEIMPKEFVYRRKQGFGAPILAWLKEPSINKEIERIVWTDNHPLYKYVSRKKVRNIFKKTWNKSSVSKGPWCILCLALWLELHQKYHE